jgi:hypothetical protein
VGTVVKTTILALAVASAGCDRRADASTPDAGASDAAASEAGPPSPAVPPASASVSPEEPSLQVLKLVFTSDVKNKEPVDRIARAEPGRRVYVHLTMRNRASETRPITVIFRVNNDQRSKIELKVERSWSYRTWAYSTLRSDDLSGKLTVEVLDARGATLATDSLPIQVSTKPVPLPSKQ